MKDKEKIRAEIERLKESGCASPIVICDTLLAFIDSMREESKPKFKVGQTITDPTDSTFTFHINKIEDGRYIEKEDEWVLVKEADANYELVEEPEITEFRKELTTMVDYAVNHAKSGVNVVDIFADRIFEYAKLEFEKDLPKWKRYKGGPYGLLSFRLGLKELYHNGFCIELSELEKLPKEESI